MEIPLPNRSEREFWSFIGNPTSASQLHPLNRYLWGFQWPIDGWEEVSFQGCGYEPKPKRLKWLYWEKERARFFITKARSSDFITCSSQTRLWKAHYCNCRDESYDNVGSTTTRSVGNKQQISTPTINKETIAKCQEYQNSKGVKGNNLQNQIHTQNHNIKAPLRKM